MPLNREAMLEYHPPDEPVAYGVDKTILYALSIGLGTEDLGSRAISLVHENGLIAFPTMAFVIGWSSVLSNPDFGLERGKQVVAGLGLQLHGTLPAHGAVRVQNRIPFVSDLGKGALIRVRRTLSTEDGTEIAAVDTDVFVRGAGGFSATREAGEEHAGPPDRPAEVTCDIATPPDMALLYRLNGDRNPLHADPEFARRAGFDRPILHGQATFAIAVRALMRSVVAFDVSRLRSVRARLVRPFYPGQSLRTGIWFAKNRVLFRCWAIESDTVVIDNGEAVVAA